ncbi:hypothetical protein D3C77_648230 [compost metagenome]
MHGAGIDQLHLALAQRVLVVGQHPDISANAGVVEQVGGQGNDRLQPVVLQYPTTDLRLARAGAAVEQWRAGQHDADAAAAQLNGLALGQQVHEEQQRAIAHPWQARAEAARVALLDVLVLYQLLHLLPLHSERRVG